MKLKVKVKDTALKIETIHIDAESTVKHLIEHIVGADLTTWNMAEDLTIKGHEGVGHDSLRLSTLFCDIDKVYMSNIHISITLTAKHVASTLANQTLLDYSKVVQAVEKYDEALNALAVVPGTVFFVQQDADQYLIRRELSGIEIFHFGTQYQEAFRETGRNPIVYIELKTRDALSDSELKWVRTIMFPSRNPCNPLIHLNHPPISQNHLNLVATLIHRLVVIMGKFQISGTYLESSDMHLPTYVQLGEQCSIGYIERAQLENIR
ncbi:hypothetical protein J4760_08145 [Salinicoccus sp. ID82-1]|uniref:Uncharacterized protein n=1 Tax=Salinicoccus cyprini TaxID=2493691 RepID=A0A558AX54_9STAP|nr:MULTISPECIES: hypothetical protein [Salinicoccus]MCG1009988.1 hypothetical protein [Salinicoccus sp. ID82-1]TVT28840.1 hypothetical protein FO441_00750 [Salinicoccus cyprini]